MPLVPVSAPDSRRAAATLARGAERTAGEPGASEGRLEGELLDAGTLFRLHAPFVAGFLVRMGVQRDRLEDLLQEVFLVAHARGGFVPQGARATTWLAEIAIRVLSARRRSARRTREELDPDSVALAPAPGPWPGQAVEAREGLARVQEALDTLDLNHRAVFVLFELEQRTCDEIADGLGIPVGTVYSRLHKARRDFLAAHARITQAPPARRP